MLKNDTKQQSGSRFYQDIIAISEGKVLRLISAILFDAGFKAIMNHRLASYLYKRWHFRFIPRWLRYRSRVKYAIDIDFRADIDGGLRIVHGAGIVIGCDVRIGKDVTLYQGVTLGGNSGKKKIKDGIEYSQPWLEDGAKCYANSIVIGPVHIGKNSSVGAGTTITRDVPDCCTVFQKQTLMVKEI